jgi:D-alanyl-D-alanine carboxypeptidase/D-alanyl-D-alanine-endopeptidase (penicillin-binding protein 4)
VTTARRWIAAILAVGALVALVVAFTGDPSASGAAPAPAASTPLWSARRFPQPIVDAVGGQRLQAAMDREVGGATTCFMVEDDGALIAQSNTDLPLVPASAQKLFVAAAALDALGPDFRFETRVLAPAPPDNGVVERLWFVGSGDPVLATDQYETFVHEQPRRNTDVFTDVEDLAQQIADAGIRSIPGGIVGDESRYDDRRGVDGWSPGYIADGDVGPMSALDVNDGNRSLDPRRPSDAPALSSATILTDLLVARGVQVGAPSTGVAPADATEITKIASPPMRDIVGSMLTTSDALSAELLAKELGVRSTNQGTTAAGMAAIAAALQKHGVPLEGVTLVDASGLHRGNRATCRSLLAVLHLGAQPPFEALWTGLSVVGERGTLINQLGGLGVDGKLSAKTGFLAGVTGFVGRIDGAQQLQFAYIDNGADYSQGVSEDIRRDTTETMLTFPDSPSADELVPAPA